MAETIKLNDMEPYIPSSSEKKQAVMMYMVVGLMFSLWKREMRASKSLMRLAGSFKLEAKLPSGTKYLIGS